MAITVNGQILRNLPEQVSKNTEDIIELQDTTNLQGDKIAALENSIITDITLNNLEVTGNTVIGNAGSDTLNVTGASSFAGNVNVTGNVTASGTLAAASASFTGNVSASGNLSVSGTISSLEKIVDTQGHRRFEEWDGVYATDVAGLSITYANTSLSGTHLMVVLAGTAENGCEIPANKNLYSVTLPQWIRDKIVPVWQDQWIERKSITLFADDWTSQSIEAIFGKLADNSLKIRTIGPLTLTEDRSFRLQFDLIIDLS